MEKDNFKTDVIFRNWNSSDFNLIIALFPYLINDNDGNVMSYESLGQHSGADYDGVIKGTTPAKENEYNSLKSELESIGYDLNIIKRRNYNRYLKALYESRKG
jgi:hypothetical protein